jgi:hypothetical protein
MRGWLPEPTPAAVAAALRARTPADWVADLAARFRLLGWP